MGDYIYQKFCIFSNEKCIGKLNDETVQWNIVKYYILQILKIIRHVFKITPYKLPQLLFTRKK